MQTNPKIGFWVKPVTNERPNEFLQKTVRQVLLKNQRNKIHHDTKWSTKLRSVTTEMHSIKITEVFRVFRGNFPHHKVLQAQVKKKCY